MEKRRLSASRRSGASAGVVAVLRRSHHMRRDTRHTSHEAATSSGIGVPTISLRGPGFCYSRATRANLGGRVSTFTTLTRNGSPGGDTYNAFGGPELVARHAAEAVDVDSLRAHIGGVRAGVGW